MRTVTPIALHIIIFRTVRDLLMIYNRGDESSSPCSVWWVFYILLCHLYLTAFLCWWLLSVYHLVELCLSTAWFMTILPTKGMMLSSPRICQVMFLRPDSEWRACAHGIMIPDWTLSDTPATTSSQTTVGLHPAYIWSGSGFVQIQLGYSNRFHCHSFIHKCDCRDPSACESWPGVFQNAKCFHALFRHNDPYFAERCSEHTYTSPCEIPLSENGRILILRRQSWLW